MHILSSSEDGGRLEFLGAKGVKGARGARGWVARSEGGWEGGYGVMLLGYVCIYRNM